MVGQGRGGPARGGGAPSQITGDSLAMLTHRQELQDRGFFLHQRGMTKAYPRGPVGLLSRPRAAQGPWRIGHSTEGSQLPRSLSVSS